MSHTTNSHSEWAEVAKRFPSMSRDELLETKYKILDEKLTIQHQLDIAEAAEQEGQKINKIWKAKAIRALASRQRYIDEINDRIGPITIASTHNQYAV